MSADARITLTWGDDDHVFRLALGQIRELQDKCKAGPAELLRRMYDSTWRVDDIREVLRLGLIGGGKEPVDALILVRRYVDERPLMESVFPAQTVLGAALFGVEGDDVGKARAENAATATPDSSGSPSSMDQELSSDGHLPKSTSAASGSSQPPSTDTIAPMVAT